MYRQIVSWARDRKGTAALEAGLIFSLFLAPLSLATGEFLHMRTESKQMREAVHNVMISIAQSPESYTDDQAEVLLEAAAGTGAAASITTACEDPDRLYATGGAEGDQHSGYCGPADEQLVWRVVTVTRPYSHLFFDGLVKNNQISVQTAWRVQ